MALSSKHRKTLTRIWNENPNGGYSEVESLILALGGTIKSGGKGSHFRTTMDGERTTTAKPHGSAKTLDIGAVKGIKDFSKSAEVTEDGN